jgi:hypothetical protein
MVKKRAPLGLKERSRCRLVYMGHSRARQPVRPKYIAKHMLAVGYQTLLRQSCRVLQKTSNEIHFGQVC